MAKKAAPQKSKKDDKTKAIKKDPKQAKKPAAASAKKAAAGKDKGSNLLELGLLCDCTSSMGSWIERAKTTLKEIIQNVVESCDGLKVRVCFVGYRDHGDQQRFTIQDFTDDIEGVKNFIGRVQAIGGADFPEDVPGGLRRCLDQNWTAGSSKQVFHIFDAPCHGKKYCDGWDNYPNGCPEGLDIEALMREFRDKSIAFTCIKLNEQCEKMIKAMKANHPALNITDLSNAVQTKSSAEVSKMFVESASYILRAAVGGKDGGAKGGKGSSKRTAVKNGVPLWDQKKLATGDHFSCISYLKVLKIDGNQVTVQNQLGGSWFITKDLLVRDMWSADHFEKEIKCTMTDLSEILDSMKDTIFKVQFRKKLDEKLVADKLSKVKFADIKKEAELKKITKDLIEGEQVTFVGHKVESDNNLGRTLMIDLEADPKNNFRQIDHRSIEHIIYRNVKYVLGRKDKNTPDELPLKVDRDAAKWTQSKLAVGNWFSSVQYYKIKSITDKDNAQVATPQNSSMEFTMSRDILEYEMHSATLFDKTEKISRTELIDLLIGARETVFTVTFHTKVDEKWVKEVLTEAGKDDFTNDKKKKDLSKKVIAGRQTEMTCFLTSTEGKLGRSSCMDLNVSWGMNFRQIDHRTVESLILKNVKYVVK